MPKVLGLDVGNAKLKLVHVDYQSHWEQSTIYWKSVPLPYTEQRLEDFSKGLPLQIRLFALVHGLRIEDWDAVVLCSSHSYSFENGAESVRQLAGILEELFEGGPVYFARADAQLTPLQELALLSETALYGYVLTNFLGSAYLGSKLITKGISIDTGTTTTDLIPIVNGRIDPGGLSEVEGYLKYRYAHGRIHWLGLNVTPLSMLATEIPVGEHTYQVVPRNDGTDNLFALLPEADPHLLTEHAYAKQFPSPEDARYNLAQFVGLDTLLLTPEEVLDIQRFLFQRLKDKVAEAIIKVAYDTFQEPPQELEFAAFALGESVLVRPVLAQLGVPENQIKGLEIQRDSALWSASSAFSMALLGLEMLLESPLELPS